MKKVRPYFIEILLHIDNNSFALGAGIATGVLLTISTFLRRQPGAGWFLITGCEILAAVSVSFLLDSLLHTPSLWCQFRRKCLQMRLQELEEELAAAQEELKAAELAGESFSDLVAQLKPLWVEIAVANWKRRSKQQHRFLFEKEPIKGIVITAEAAAITTANEKLTIVIRCSSERRRLAEKIAGTFVRTAKLRQRGAVPSSIWLKPPPPEAPIHLYES